MPDLLDPSLQHLHPNCSETPLATGMEGASGSGSSEVGCSADAATLDAIYGNGAAFEDDAVCAINTPRIPGHPHLSCVARGEIYNAMNGRLADECQPLAVT